MGAPLGIVGNLNLDLWVGPVTRFPGPDEEVLAGSSRLELAGTAGYVLQAALALGVEPRVVSTIGGDAFGTRLLADLERLGCGTAGVEVVDGNETSLGIIFVRADGSRGILTTLGAHAVMDPAVAERHDDWVAPCAEVLLCGAYLLPRFGPEALVPYAATLRRRGQVVAFDPSWDPAGWPEETRSGTMRLLREVDVYLPNEPEVLALTGRHDLDAAIADVAHAAGEIVVKRGERGAVYVRNGTRVDVPAFAVRAVNTIGAGDAFDAAYLFARRRGLAPRERLRFANAAAALVVGQIGGRAYPDRDRVEAAIAAWDAGTVPAGVEALVVGAEGGEGRR
jgi:sugar/nucleoside kinase (ribokinase family)